MSGPSSTHKVRAAPASGLRPLGEHLPLGEPGRLNGQSIQRVKPAAVQQRRHTPAASVVQPPPDATRALNMWQGRAEQPVAPSGLQDIARRAHATGIVPHRLAAQTRALLRNPRTGRLGSASARALLAGLDGEDENDLIAFLTPVEGVHHDAQGLAKRFQQAEDGEELAELLKDLLPGQTVLPSEPRALFDALKTVRHHPDQLMKLLARVHAIPHPIKEREELKQVLEDRLRERELTTDGALEAGRFRAAGAASGLADPERFLQTFEEAKTHEKGGWVQQLQALARTYSTKDLPGALAALVQAMGVELELVKKDKGGVEAARLGAINSELQQAYKCRSLVLGAADMDNWIGRLAAARAA